MNAWQFLKSRVFWKHFIIIVLVSLILIWGIMKILDLYTRHGKYYVVPDVKGLTIDEIKAEKYKGNLKFVVIDSIFDNNHPKGSVVDQEPDPGTNVKYGRKIYLTTVAVLPEMVNMPDLQDLTLRQALALLETYGLKQGRLEYVPDIAENAVLEQRYKGKKINPGTLIEKGSRIDLVLGKGLNAEECEEIVPNLIGKFRDEAFLLSGKASMNIGTEVFLDNKDTVNARIVKQLPLPGQKICHGQPIDLWYRSNKKFNFSSFLKDSI